MAQVLADRKDIDFVLYEQLEAEKLCENELFSDFNKKTFGMILDEARNLAVKEILPTFTEGDREGVRFENGEVKVPECFHRPFKLLVEGEWTAMTADPELGGQGLPSSIALAASEYISGANCAFTAYGMEGHAAGRMIEIFGTDAQKDLFLKKMYTGKWGGTMVLTESQAGSDVGALTTTAKKNPDGTYTITGNKIFITNGDHDLVENIIHPVLARIEGAPEGTRGISLFIVPKIRVSEDGSLKEANDVICTGIEEKMGIHGSATCSLSFGSKGKCQGFLLGEENKGMKIMFHMMNEVRIMVGGIGFNSASAAYMYAANYAKERIQGKDLEKALDAAAPSVPIIRHPDVRRMLIWMKAHVDGMRSLIYYATMCIDRERCVETEEEKIYYNDMLNLLTPIIKSYCTDRGIEVCSQAMQVYGGYGYTSEYPVEQLFRDVRITSIYEGTNGIQAMDLLARKLGMKEGRVFMNLMAEMQKTAAKAKEIEQLQDLAVKFENAVNKMGEIAFHMGTTAMSPKLRTAFTNALPFLDIIGDVIMAWMLLWRATISSPSLEKLVGNIENEDKRMKKIETDKKAAFHYGQIKTAEYFILSILPVTIGKMNAIKTDCEAAVEIPEASLGG
ncbi:acyl-CoA dehydrogenase [Desulfobacterales bacterium HSG16]|nr:acyl-CoA dehydrogenase [Desulfobacterales bacterium HSG16]